MEITTKSIKEIKPYEKNPRKNDESVKYVAESIKQFGFKVPIVIDSNNIIICGHTRYKAAKQLKLKEVPCIYADDLDDEQVKAFRLADNKVSEKSQWDLDLLADELSEIMDIDMSAFDFDLGLIDDNYTNDISNNEDKVKEETVESEYYGSERERTFNAYNLYEVDSERLTGKWQMPILKKCEYIPEDLISFNYAKTSKDFHKGIHFYIDDYQFERIWNAPHDYMDMLKKFDCVLTPDFSLYTEMPLPMQIYNVYRSKLIGQIMQDYGIKVIPTLQWCMPNSFDFAFDGIEPGGTVSVSTIGVKQDKNAKKIWAEGMNEAIKQLKPKNIIVYGGKIDYDFKNINIVYMKNHNTERISNAD